MKAIPLSVIRSHTVKIVACPKCTHSQAMHNGLKQTRKKTTKVHTHTTHIPNASSNTRVHLSNVNRTAKNYTLRVRYLRYIYHPLTTVFVCFFNFTFYFPSQFFEYFFPFSPYLFPSRLRCRSLSIYPSRFD